MAGAGTVCGGLRAASGAAGRVFGEAGNAAGGYPTDICDTHVTVNGIEPRSAYFLSGPARWEWEHSIPPLEQLRYSLTFRNIREAGLHHRTDRPTIDHELSGA
jgi:hypothetical protein